MARQILVIKVGHLLSELGLDLEISDTLLLTLLSRIQPCKFDAILSVDDQPSLCKSFGYAQVLIYHVV